MYNANDPGQYLYENYVAIFWPTGNRSWPELSEPTRALWAKLELTTRIDCTCGSDPLGRCVVHAVDEQRWHPANCQCGNCPGKQKMARVFFADVFRPGLHGWTGVGDINNRSKIEVSAGVLMVNGEIFAPHLVTPKAWMIEVEHQRG